MKFLNATALSVLLATSALTTDLQAQELTMR
jgi:hypothetical protein